MFPDHIECEDPGGREAATKERCSASCCIEQAVLELRRALDYVLPARPHQGISEKAEDSPDTYIARLLLRLPAIQETLWTDILAAYQGDPAARGVDEVVLAYPAFTAIGAYRIAHELYLMDVPMIPRIMTEYAHQLTGIDIHPGARIGESFFIDHGTGVVIGETTTIGHRVKLYQNVTLGAKSFEAAPDGSLVKGIKRHPDIGNDVVIYAGATILGGDTVIGDHCVIGGNVWLTRSVEAGSTVLNSRPEPVKIS
ncbi:MAG: serine acetyltransferase [Fretibacterium sp.]|nr:serine acetyltransferase [Fretibacterium sp.]